MYDVIIVGLGPAGNLTALSIAENSGLNVFFDNNLTPDGYVGIFPEGRDKFRKTVKDNILLVGDAAGHIDPFGGGCIAIRSSKFWING